MSIWHERATKVWLTLIALTVVTTWGGLSKDLFSPAVAVGGDVPHRGPEGQIRDVGLHGIAVRAGGLADLFFQGWIVVVVAIVLGFWFGS